MQKAILKESERMRLLRHIMRAEPKANDRLYYISVGAATAYSVTHWQWRYEYLNRVSMTTLRKIYRRLYE